MKPAEIAKKDQLTDKVKTAAARYRDFLINEKEFCAVSVFVVYFPSLTLPSGQQFGEAIGFSYGNDKFAFTSIEESRVFKTSDDVMASLIKRGIVRARVQSPDVAKPEKKSLPD